MSYREGAKLDGCTMACPLESTPSLALGFLAEMNSYNVKR